MKDFIEKLISRLEEFQKISKIKGIYGEYMAYSNVIEIVNQLSEESSFFRVPLECWIPVSERLPDIDGMYLTTVFDKSTKRYMLRHRKFEKGRFVQGGNSKDFPVVAWHSLLPEPYKGE